MSPKDELQKVTEERDSLRRALEEEQAQRKITDGVISSLQLQRDEADSRANNCPPPESGFSTNFHMTHKAAGIQQFTFRGREASDWPAVLDEIGKFAGYMADKGWTFNVPQVAPPPVASKAAAIVREAGNESAAQAIESNGAEVPPPPAGKQWLTLDASRVVILPKPDERVAVEFYASGHKFPDLKTTWKAEQVAGLLKYVTSHDVTKAADLALACRVYYTLGKEYTNAQTGAKGHYKDIGHVRPLAS